MKDNKAMLDLVYDGDDSSVPVPEEIIKAGVIISHGAFRCWAVLRSYARKKGDRYGTRKCFPSRETIADAMGISVMQTYKYTNELLEVGLLVAIGQKRREEDFGVINVYEMMNPRLWSKKLGKLLKKDRKEKKEIRYKKQSQKLREYRDTSD